jgi:hypothetical protein
MMLQSIKDYMLAGTPAHYLQLLAVLGYAVLEWGLPRQKALAANSTIELLANMLLPLLGKVPLVGKLVSLLATPEAKQLGLPKVVSVLLPLALAGTLLSACATPGGKALSACELNSLPSAAGTLIAQLVSIAFSGGNYQQQLTTAGETAGVNNLAPQFNCALQAVAAWLGAPHGQLTPGVAQFLEAAGEYLQTHGARACAPQALPRLTGIRTAMEWFNENPTAESPVHWLITRLQERDNGEVDLKAIGRGLRVEYPDGVGELALVAVWRAMSHDEPLYKATDESWVKAQPPRVQDVAWLLANPKEWYF